MDTSKISFGEMVAAASGLALFIIMFLPWFGVEVDTGIGDVSESGNAWETLSFIDILLFLIALLAIGLAVARATGNVPTELPAPAGMIVAAAGALAVILILFRIISTPGPDNLPDEVDITRKIGVFLGLIAAGGIAFGGYTAANERTAGRGPGGTTGGGTTGAGTTGAGTTGGTTGAAPPPPPPPAGGNPPPA